jgi:DNA polymerase I
MTDRHLLIDADVLAYKAAAAVEVATEWDEGYWTWHCDEQEVKARIEDELEKHLEVLKATSFTLCLTDTVNFRKQVLPTYKGNRKSTKKPLVLSSIRKWMLDDYDAFMRPGLEGDDVMGILSTWSKYQEGMEKVIVSIDKDMKTIPGLYCRDLISPLMDVTEDEADYWHMAQTLTGDTTDGYSGCPGIGPKKAEAILGDDPSWSKVVAAYDKAGLSEEVALQQARVARILRASDYDFKNKEVILWEPT